MPVKLMHYALPRVGVDYRFRLFDKSERFVAGQFVRCDNDGQARAHADTMLTRRGIARVEVWHGQRQVYDSSTGPRAAA